MVSIWLARATLTDFYSRLHRLPMAQWRYISRGYLGMVLAHLGVAVTALGITVTSAYSVEKDVRLVDGEHISVGSYDFNFIGVSALTGANYQGVRGEFAVYHQGKMIATLYPERRINNVKQMLTTKTAIDAGLFRDLVCSFGGEVSDNSWAVRVYYKPLIRWIWLGAI